MRRWAASFGLVGIVLACSNGAPAEPAIAESVRDAATDSTPPPPPNDAAMDEAAVACAPHPFSGPTRAVPPRPWHENACSASEVESFVAACAHGATGPCDAFEREHPTCFTCAVSRESDRAWGPLVVHEGGEIVPNVAGCIANALGDLSDEGCGAARGRLRHCGERACRGCLPVTDEAAYAAFEACIESAEGAKVFADELATYRAKCAAHLDPKPGDATYPCLGVGLSAEARVRAYVIAFCTADADAGDAAAD